MSLQTLLRKYEGTENIFFEYDPNHSHDIGPLITKLRLSAEIKQEVLFCFQQGWSFIAVRENLKLKMILIAEIALLLIENSG